MNFARVAMAAVAAWVVSIPVGYVVNDIILKDTFTANAAVLRPEAEVMANVPLGFVFMLGGFFVFAYVYAKGYEGGQGIMEGIRYGVLVALMINCFAFSWWYITVPINGAMAVSMMIDAIVEYSLYGAIVGAIYKRAGASVARAAAV